MHATANVVVYDTGGTVGFSVKTCSESPACAISSTAALVSHAASEAWLFLLEISKH